MMADYDRSDFPTFSRQKLVAGLCVWIALCFLAPAVGAFSPPDEWYRTLAKPTWNPSGWVFGPVWMVLYTMMAVSAWLVWQRGGITKQQKPLSAFMVQLIFNAAWTPLFFGVQRPDLAFIDIILLWLSILVTIILFYQVRRLAAWLLIPYLAWVSFAAVLNATLWNMNA